MATQLTKDNPARTLRDVTIAEQRLQGMSMREIAKANDVSAMTVSRVLNDEDIKATIDQAARQLASLAPRVYSNYDRLTQSADDRIALESTRDVSKIIGIQGTHTPSLVVNLYSQVNNNHIDVSRLDQRLAELLGASAASQLLGESDDIVDITIDPRDEEVL